ncbi:MAG: heme o synthase [Pseudanabaenaceae cyanobacterium]
MTPLLFTTERHASWPSVGLSYLQLTKPRIIFLLLVSTAGAMWIASEGQVSLYTLGVTLLGGAMAAGAANTLNCWYDADIDRVMDRTRFRPIPAGRVAPHHALMFAAGLAIAALLLLGTQTNWLAAGLAMAGLATYVGVYTLWLKRSSPQNIVIGGAAGAIPPLVGWAAVTGSLDWPAWVLFGLIFLWTPPHFWALAILLQEDYARAEVPMLPVVVGNRPTAWQMWGYTLTLLPVSLLLVYPLGVMGPVYAVAALGLSAGFIYETWRFTGDPDNRQRARNLFKYSIYYILFLSLAMGLDTQTGAIIDWVRALGECAPVP